MNQPTAPGPGNSAPSTPEEALEIVRPHYAPTWPDGTPAPLNVVEFDEGYLVYASLPPVTDRTRPPEPGGAYPVVAKDNGDVDFVPIRPIDVCIETYRRLYRPGATGSRNPQ
ncbi:hypothetical protein AB0A70_06080 [Streptomyces morookaense]|uniref:hypothetical protein n=1 Tax=Streptomyces morookaense TaxID=1970 RepID=UPI00340F5259